MLLAQADGPSQGPRHVGSPARKYHHLRRNDKQRKKKGRELTYLVG